MKCSLGISDFLGEISSLSHSIVFLYFFTLFTEEGFLISPCYSLELCIQMGVSFLFSFAFHFSVFSQLFVSPPQTAILLFCIFFSWGWSWSLSPVPCHKLLSIVHHNHRKLANLITQTTALSNSVKLSHAVWDHPRWMGFGGEVWQNVVHWRTEWQATSVFLPWEPHEQYEKAKR